MQLDTPAKRRDQRLYSLPGKLVAGGNEGLEVGEMRGSGKRLGGLVGQAKITEVEAAQMLHIGRGRQECDALCGQGVCAQRQRAQTGQVRGFGEGLSPFIGDLVVG